MSTVLYFYFCIVRTNDTRVVLVLYNSHLLFNTLQWIVVMVGVCCLCSNGLARSQQPSNQCCRSLYKSSFRRICLNFLPVVLLPHFVKIENFGTNSPFHLHCLVWTWTYIWFSFITCCGLLLPYNILQHNLTPKLQQLEY